MKTDCRLYILLSLSLAMFSSISALAETLSAGSVALLGLLGLSIYHILCSLHLQFAHLTEELTDA